MQRFLEVCTSRPSIYTKIQGTKYQLIDNLDIRVEIEMMMLSIFDSLRLPPYMYIEQSKSSRIKEHGLH